MVGIQCTAAAAATAEGCSRIYDLLIVGGGLSGLVVASGIHHGVDAHGNTAASSASSLPPTNRTSTSTNTQNTNNSHKGCDMSWLLLEARSVLGGRLANDEHGHNIDMGGAWIWPQHQPHMRRLIQQLGVSTWVQPDDPSSRRVVGGAVELVHALARPLPPERVQLNTPVTKCTLVRHHHHRPSSNAANNIDSDERGESTDTETVIQVQTGTGDDADATSVLTARRVVIAVPPKLISKYIQFDPPLSPTRQRAMEASRTWMAGVTKVSLIYRTKFWNEHVSNTGLPSHSGPAFQVYDASTRDGSVSALTFFALVPPDSAAATDDHTLAEQVAMQMGHVWDYHGEKEMANQVDSYTTVHVKRWPLEEYISDDPKPRQVHPHPHPVADLSANEWDNRLMFAGSESDQLSPGVMEGAVGAARRVLTALLSSVT